MGRDHPDRAHDPRSAWAKSRRARSGPDRRHSGAPRGGSPLISFIGSPRHMCRGAAPYMYGSERRAACGPAPVGACADREDMNLWLLVRGASCKPIWVCQLCEADKGLFCEHCRVALHLVEFCLGYVEHAGDIGLIAGWCGEGPDPVDLLLDGRSERVRYVGLELH